MIVNIAITIRLATIIMTVIVMIIGWRNSCTTLKLLANLGNLGTVCGARVPTSTIVP